MQNPHALFFCSFALAVSAPAADKTFVLTVEAGDYDRRGTEVEFGLPEAAKHFYLVKASDGKRLPLQVKSDLQGAFRIDQLKKGERATYELLAPLRSAGGPRRENQVVASRDQAKVKFSFTGRQSASRPIFDYQGEPGAFPRADIKPAFRRGGYLHPIYTPSGKLVTDDFPPNHVHHHGVWWAWTNTEFERRKPDFWNVGDGKGRVEFVSLDETWSGPVHGGLRARHRFVDLTATEPVVALNETWEVKAFVPSERSGSYSIFDLVSEQECATTNALKLPEYRYGGIGVRGNWAWNGKDKALFLTSEGETDREKGHATRARWCDMGGMVDGSRVGIAILCHPENFRAPQPMRIHPTEPFFNFAPQQAGDMEIKPGDKYISRYRFVVHDGPPDKAELDRLWNDYAHPPVVRIEAK
jgi:hypothetical protein